MKNINFGSKTIMNITSHWFIFEKQQAEREKEREREGERFTLATLRNLTIMSARC